MRDGACIAQILGSDVQPLRRNVTSALIAKLCCLDLQLLGRLDRSRIAQSGATVIDGDITLAAQRAAVIDTFARYIQIGIGMVARDYARVAQLPIGTQGQADCCCR